MIRSFYTINRNMNILQIKQGNISSNISNVTTPGYKFQDMVQSTLNELPINNFTGGRGESRQDLGTFTFGNRIDHVYRDFEQGSLSHTDQTTDFAIAGEGFFTIIVDGQYGYTRNGNFTVNVEGQLVTQEGYPVLGISGGEVAPIWVDENNFNVDQYGQIQGQGVDLLIADIENIDGLEEIGNNIFIGQDFNIAQTQVRQGYLEMSNVKIADELVKMIQTSREFEASQKALQTADDTLSKAVNEIGKV